VIAWVSLSTAQTVTGTVINSVTGAGVPGVKVNLVWSGDIAYSTTTDAQGQFLFDHVQDGAYMATFTSPDYVIDPSGPQRVLRFQMTAGTPVNLEAHMTPLARLSGRVVDGRGKPVAGAEVSVTGVNSATMILADTDGKFEVHQFLIPGAYILSAAPPVGLQPPDPEPDRVLNWTRTYYPGVTNREAAAKITLAAGAEVSDIELKLLAAPAYPVLGVLLNPDGKPAPKVQIDLSPDLAQLRTESDGDGQFEFPAVVNGEWQCSAEVERGGVKLRASQWFEMAGQALESIKLRLAPPFTVHAKIVMETPQGSPPPRPPGLTLGMHQRTFLKDLLGDGFVVGATPGSPNGRPDENGDIALTGVYPGSYKILPANAPPGYYLDSMRFGEAEVTTAEVEISSGGVPITLIYKTNGGAVRGTVENCASGAVAAIPQDPSMRRPGFFRSTSCGSSGDSAAGAGGDSIRYEIDTLRPGDYYVVAISGDGPDPWYLTKIDDALLSQATKITVRAGESSSADLRAIAPTQR